MIEKLNNESMKNCSGGDFKLYEKEGKRYVGSFENLKEVREYLRNDNITKMHLIIREISPAGHILNQYEYRPIDAFDEGRFIGEAWIKDVKEPPKSEEVIYCYQSARPELMYKKYKGKMNPILK